MYFPYAGYHRLSGLRKWLTMLGILLYIFAVLSLINHFKIDDQQRKVKVVSEGVPYNTGKTTRATQFTKNCLTFTSGEGFDRTVVLSNSPKARTKDGMSVPFARVIHRMWKTSVVPDSWSLGLKTCREFNPDWLYCHWTDEELASFIDSEYPDFRSTYDAYPYDIQRSDAVRYLLLYHYGGLYLDLDIDIVCRLSFNAVISEFRDKSPSLTGSGVILAEGEPFVGVMSEFIAVHKRFDQVMSHVMSGLSVSTKP